MENELLRGSKLAKNEAVVPEGEEGEGEEEGDVGESHFHTALIRPASLLFAVGCDHYVGAVTGISLESLLTYHRRFIYTPRRIKGPCRT
jgi:hypothetical protein